MVKVNPGEIRLIAFDLDGTLTQHKTPLDEKNRAVLDALREHYSLVMVGAGQSGRIYRQMGEYPIDIIGNYGMQLSRYNHETGQLETVFDECVPCDRESVSARIEMLREKYGFTAYRGESVEFHGSGCVTFPLLGTKALPEEKLAFDPDRSKRRVFYEDVKETLSEGPLLLILPPPLSTNTMHWTDTAGKRAFPTGMCCTPGMTTGREEMMS